MYPKAVRVLEVYGTFRYNLEYAIYQLLGELYFFGCSG